LPLIGQKQGKQRWLRSEGRDKYKIVGVKLQDYLDFKKVADLMRTKDHLTTLLLPFALKKQEPKQSLPLLPLSTFALDWSKAREAKVTMEARGLRTN
jgi:hypothetical protein